MSLNSSELPPQLGTAPELAFDVLDARAAEHAATPTLLFDVEIRAPGHKVRSIDHGLPVAVYSPNSTGAAAYRALAEELLNADQPTQPASTMTAQPGGTSNAG